MSYTPLEKETIQFLSSLVQCVSLSGEEDLVAAEVIQKMKSLDFDEAFRDEHGNVIGIRRGAIPGAKVVYDSHMDTVMVANPEEWTHAPWGGEILNGRIWGRGSSDTKGSLASSVMALGSLPRSELAGTAIVVGTVGEEIIEGAALARVLDSLEPDAVIIGEPTDCRLAVGQKGRARLNFTARGRSAHTANPEEGVNAIDKAYLILQRIRSTPPRHDPIMGTAVMEPLLISSKPTPSTSTVPYECTISFDRRLMLGETIQSILDEYRTLLDGMQDCTVDMHEAGFITCTGIEIIDPDFHAAWLMQKDSPIVQLSEKALREVGIEPGFDVVPYCTNGSASAVMGHPTLIFGPSSIRMAHAVDEYIEIPELLRGLQGYLSLGRALGHLPSARIS